MPGGRRDAKKADKTRTFVCEVAAPLSSCRKPQRVGLSAVADHLMARRGTAIASWLSARRRNFALPAEDILDIRFISSMTNDDENRFASVLMNAMDELLRHLPIVYHVRINTTAGGVLQRSRAVAVAPGEGVEREVV